MNQWIEPKSLEEATERMATLLAKIDEITLQLAEPRDMKPMFTTDRAYQDWKRRAKFARAARQDDYRRCKVWVEAYKRGQHQHVVQAHAAAAVEGIEGGDLLLAAYRTLKELGRRIDYAFSTEEQVIVDTMRDFLRSKGVSV